MDDYLIASMLQKGTCSLQLQCQQDEAGAFSMWVGDVVEAKLSCECRPPIKLNTTIKKVGRAPFLACATGPQARRRRGSKKIAAEATSRRANPPPRQGIFRFSLEHSGQTGCRRASSLPFLAFSDCFRCSGASRLLTKPPFCVAVPPPPPKGLSWRGFRPFGRRRRRA
eukprot:scaffold578_cov243-Pinguiococcus_pyrenoidosus.AAC.26